MASCSHKRSVISLEEKLEVITVLKEGLGSVSAVFDVHVLTIAHVQPKFKVTGIFKILGTSWSYAAPITEVPLYFDL